eukprot:4904627-Amphidinium_carterae.1
MSDVQVQPWFQYEDDITLMITMFSEHAVKDAMNKELSQLINMQSFVEFDKRSLTAEHFATSGRYTLGYHDQTQQQRYKGHQVQVLWKRIFTIYSRHQHTDLCGDTFINGNETLADNRDHQEVHSLYNGRG